MITPSDLYVRGIQLGRELGRGSFGAVYLGQHLALDVPVAVKVLDVAGRVADAQKALREARIMARLDHPNIVRIHDTDSVAGVVYLVLEYMDGGSLDDTRDVPAVTLEDTARQLLAGLQCLHDAGVVHRDVKPANCLRRASDGRIKLADLGIAASAATISQERTIAGTLPFMAPELLDGVSASPASDLYALGLTLLCAALKSDPFPATGVGEVVEWVMRGPRPDLATARPDLPRSLRALLDRLIAPRPDDRPESAAQALSLLDAPSPRVHSVLPVPDERAVGPWIVGETVREGSNWRVLAVTHGATGMAARLAHLKSGGTLDHATEVVLEAAERATESVHPGVLEVYDWGRWHNRAYVVTAPQGRSLDDLVASGGPLPEHEAAALVADVADAVAYLHARNLVFQMVEPGAVCVSGDGRAGQLGWPLYCVPAGIGVQHPSGRSRRMVVLAHAAPEVFQGATTIEPAVDLYGLGEVLFFLLSGRRAHPANATGALALSKLGPTPDLREAAPHVTAPTVQLTTRLLSADPAARPSAASVRDTLRRVAARLSARSPVVTFHPG